MATGRAQRPHTRGRAGGHGRASARRPCHVTVSDELGNRLAEAITGTDGRFDIAVASGPHSVNVTKAGYAPARFGGVKELAPDALDLTLPRRAVVRGRVMTIAGHPVKDVPVRVSAKAPETMSGPVTVHTDDLGEYRAGSLPAGEYEISIETARLGSAIRLAADGGGTVTGELMLFAPAIHARSGGAGPGASVAPHVQPVVLRASQESAIDFVHDRFDGRFLRCGVQRWRADLAGRRLVASHGCSRCSCRSSARPPGVRG
jgi:hypothetical protein